MTIRLLQLTDPHIGADWAAGDPVASLRTVIAAVRALPFSPDGVIVTGDLAADGTDAQYAALAPVLAELELPLAVLPGNHDDRAALRRHFAVGDASAGDGPLSHVHRVGTLRVVMLDTTVPGAGGGDLDDARLAWLEAALAGGADEPTLVAMHHPPVLTGIAGMDAIGLPPAAREGLAEIVGRHPQVCGLVAGHQHRTIATTFAGRPLLVAPTTYCQLALDPDGRRLQMEPQPLGFAIHTVIDGRLVSHVETLAVTADAL